jgi:hypothetical protein
MNHAYREYGVSEIQFCSAQFPTQIEWLTSFRNLLKQNELKMEWSCHSRVDMVSTESLELMKECGCKNILFGMESFEIGTLDRIGKNIHPEQVVQAVFECRKSRIETTGSFMMALPSEKPGAVVRNALKAVTMGIDYFQLFIAKWEVIPPHYEMFFIQRSSWETTPFDYCGVALIPDGYKNMRHLKMIKMLAYLVFYLHPRTLFRFLMKIRRFSDLKRFLSGFYVLSKLTGTSLKKQRSSLSFRTEADALEEIPGKQKRNWNGIYG